MAEFVFFPKTPVERDEAVFQLRHAHIGFSASANQVRYSADQEFTFEPLKARRAAPILREIMRRKEGSYRGEPIHLMIHFNSPFGSGSGFENCYDLFYSRAEYEAVKKVAARVARMAYYLKEVEPEWKEVDKTYWGDNSIDSNQVDKRGNHRHVMIDGPHGDACY